jgi:hypothetical protein
MSGTRLFVGPADAVPSAIDGDTHVVLQLHPLAHALPSAWLDQIGHRLPHPYEAWLEAIFETPPKDWPTVRAFWERHHYDALARQWAAVAGPERLRIKIVDSAPETPGSLSAAEAEVLRQVNVVFHRRDWPVQRYREVMRRGVLQALGTGTQAAGGGVVTPAWAIKRANQIAASDAKQLAASGIEIDGDLAALSRVPAGRASKATQADQVDLDTAVTAVMGAVDAVAATWRR